MDNNDQQLSAAGVCPSARVQHTWFLCLIDAEIKSYYIIGVIRTTDYEYPSHSPANLLLTPPPSGAVTALCSTHGHWEATCTGCRSVEADGLHRLAFAQLIKFCFFFFNCKILRWSVLSMYPLVALSFFLLWEKKTDVKLSTVSLFFFPISDICEINMRSDAIKMSLRYCAHRMSCVWLCNPFVRMNPGH